MEKADMTDRRKYKRIPLDAKVAYNIIPDVRLREYATKDLSRGGIRFLVQRFIPKGSLVKVRITLPGPAGSFEILGKVAWIKQLSSYEGESYEVGAHFVDMTPGAADRILARIKTVPRKK